MAPADGYTVMYNLATTFTANPYLYTKLPYDPVKDFVPVATTMRQGLVLIASPAKVSAKTLKELLPALSAKPGAMSYGSYGAGTPSHLIMEWLLEETKTSVVHVPYKGSAVNDVIAGTVELAMEPISTAMPFITSGRIKALAYSGDTRHAALLDVPTLSESVPALNITSWHGIWAPAATPTAIVARLNSEFVSISRDPDMQQRIRALNVEPLGLSTAEMISLTKRDADNMSRVIKAKNITLD